MSSLAVAPLPSALFLILHPVFIVDTNLPFTQEMCTTIYIAESIHSIQFASMNYQKNDSVLHWLFVSWHW